MEQELDTLLYQRVTLRWFVAGIEHKVTETLYKTWAGYHVYGVWLPIPFSVENVGSVTGNTITLLKY
jgi:hypothetical protein